MRHKIQCLLVGLLVSGFLIYPAFAASSFPDVDENAEYAEAVEYLNEIGIMQGDENGNFNPDKTVSRAEMAAIICRMLGETENLTTSTTFTDVPASYWANGYITKATSLGIISGYGNGKFGPSDSVTYEQVVTMIIRAIGGEELAQEEGGYPTGFLAVASANGLLDRLSAQQGDPMSSSNIALLVYNCI